jgi:hypothetical protein
MSVILLILRALDRTFQCDDSVPESHGHRQYCRVMLLRESEPAGRVLTLT